MLVCYPPGIPALNQEKIASPPWGSDFFVATKPAWNFTAKTRISLQRRHERKEKPGNLRALCALAVSKRDFFV
jgi:hypothetical protein